jgi:hypothetical protein
VSATAPGRSLGLLASAITGRPVILAHLTRQGEQSFTDGEHVFLSRCEDVDRMRLELIVQCALLAGTGLGSRPLRAILGRRELRERYLLVEVLRSCRAIEERLPGPFLRELEPYRAVPPALTPEESLAIAASHRLLPRPPGWFGTIRPWRLLRSRLRPDGSRLTDQQLRQLESKLPEAGKDGRDDEDEDAITRTSLWRWLVSPIGRDNPLSRLLREVLDMRSSPEEGTTDSGASVSSEMVQGRVSRLSRDLSRAARSARSLVSRAADPEAGGDRYPEWDAARGRYRLDWTRVAEVSPGGEGMPLAPGRLPRGPDTAMLRALAGLGLGYERHRACAEGDDLVLDRMIRLATDLRIGHVGDERIYSAHLRTRRELGVQILLDASSSTLERTPDGVRIFDLQAQAALRICRAFARLGDRVAMHAFHSWGRSLVRLQNLNSFDDPLGAELEHRMSRVLVAGYTRCGAAIRHATARLGRAAGTPHRLLILVSDGFPYDDQYEGAHAAGDTRKAIEEARARGVAVVCVSVGSEADAGRLHEVYGAAHYAAVARAEQLPMRLRRLVGSAVADARRAVAG